MTGKVIAGPEITARGFVEDDVVFDDVMPQLIKALDDGHRERGDRHLRAPAGHPTLGRRVGRSQDPPPADDHPDGRRGLTRAVVAPAEGTDSVASPPPPRAAGGEAVSTPPHPSHQSRVLASNAQDPWEIDPQIAESCHALTRNRREKQCGKGKGRVKYGSGNSQEADFLESPGFRHRPSSPRSRSCPPCRGRGTTGSAPGSVPSGTGPGADLVVARVQLREPAGECHRRAACDT